MEQVAVIHTAFEDKPSTVAFVEIPNDAESTIDKLELHIGGLKILWIVGH